MVLTNDVLSKMWIKILFLTLFIISQSVMGCEDTEANVILVAVSNANAFVTILNHIL